MNFRAYRRLQTFALGADVTVLYGPNGFGKTSFFDAIDFAVTGGIGRADSRRQSDFAKTAQHLDAGTEESTVALTFRSRGAVREIVRSVRDRKHAQLDDQVTDRKGVLTALTGSNTPTTDRVENFVSLFRASHLFSQEQQELTKDFQDDCRLSADIVSRMLAFEDYANAVNKVARVREVLAEILADCADQLRTLNEQIASDRRELERLGQSAQANANPQALESELESLRAKVAKLGIVTSSTMVDASVVRGWRASLETRSAQCRADAERLTVLAREVAELPHLRSALSQLQEQFGLKESSLNVANVKQEAIEASICSLGQQQAKLGVKRTQTQAEIELLAWIRVTQPQYRKLLEQQQELAKGLERDTEKLDQLRKAETQAETDFRAKEASAVQVAKKWSVRHAELQAVQAFVQAVPVWQASREQLKGIDKAERDQLTRADAVRRELAELAPRWDIVAAEEQRLLRQIAEADANQSELRKLVSQLQGHVHDGHCPLCGEDHGSQAHLVARIQSHATRDGASAARGELVSVRGKTRNLGDAIATAKQRLVASEKQLAGFKTERERLQSNLGEFAAKAARLGILLEGDGPTPAELAQLLATRLQSDLGEIEGERTQATNATEAARTALAGAQAASSVSQAEVDRQRTTLARVQDEAQRLRNDPRLSRLNLEIDSDDLNELETQAAKEVDDTKTQSAKIEDELSQHRKNLGGLKNEIAALKSQVAAIRVQFAQTQKSIALLEAKLGQAQLPADSTDRSLLARVAEQTRLQADLAAVQAMASGLELALDAATTAAALTTLQEAIRNREKAISEVSARRERHQPWTKYFEEVAKVLSSQQNEAIADFTRAYGPRTSIIQRRLRSVYGFDDVQIKSQDSAINVRIMRNGEELRPVDYFSQSQQQTLLLGLFLTASSSQTWSAFAPVFLDDPVTHFDDLNTYAFLDLLVGLLDSGDGGRQFILSTCDEKLLQLARQKFRYLGERAKFYRFTAIGADGPMIEEITTL
jgi:exonuclease SbcC